jgi:hypothetical protein
MGRFVRSYWIFGVIARRDQKSYALRWVPLIMLHAAFPLLALVAGWADETIRLLPRGGRGVAEHYGFHALFVSAPVLVFLSWRVANALSALIAQPLPWIGAVRTEAVVELQKSIEDIATCRTPRARTLLGLMRFVGFAAVVANAASTRTPVLIYGQDVFDSSRYAVGYLAGRIFLGYYWIYLLPLVAYLAFAAVAVAVRVAAHVDGLRDYDIRCFASDGCGGFKELGRLMTMVVYLWVPIVMVIIALKETHANFYATLQLSAVLAVIIPAQLFLPFLRLHRVLSNLKERKLSALERFMTDSERAINAKDSKKREHRDDAAKRSIVPYVRLLAGDSIYRHTTAMTTWPYIKSDVMRWLTPFVPLLISVTLKRLGLS